ncbi:MAG: hypothetical protein M1812_004071 [Candelaria pacifica]|nr:MAG: hypothetical protein M1812_004071 [Candelaria pacifica]
MGKSLRRESSDTQKAVEEYILGQKDPISESCLEWQNIVAKSPGCEAQYEARRERNQDVCYDVEEWFCNQLQETAVEMDNAFVPITRASSTLHVLDFCMAPGGFAACIMDLYPEAEIDAITLLQADGGRKVITKCNEIILVEADITAYAADCCIDDCWKDSHLAKSFTSETLEHTQRYGLVICDGKTERKHLNSFGKVKELELVRLKAAQLILGLERVRPGGTLYILQHNIQSGHTIKLLWHFSHFSDVSIFKPTEWLTSSSFFYLIAKNVQTGSLALKMAIREFKQAWTEATLESKVTEVTEEEVQGLLTSFGAKLIDFGYQIWPIQEKGLRKRVEYLSIRNSQSLKKRKEQKFDNSTSTFPGYRRNLIE